MLSLSIIIPVFNEEKTIAEIIKRVAELEIPDVEKEIIVVDDGSTDTTASKIQNSNIKIRNFRHDKNMGKGAAVQTGIKNAIGDYIVIQDADLEYDPKYIESLLQPIIEGRVKVVYGTRLKRLPNFARDEKTPQFLLHYLGNKFLSLITSLFYGQWITDMETCYKVFPRQIVRDLNLKAHGFDFEAEITAKLLKKRVKILEIPIRTEPRGYDEGKKLNTIEDGTIALWTLFKYRFTD